MRIKIFIGVVLSLMLNLGAAGAAPTPEESAPVQRPTIYLRVGQRYPVEGLLVQEAKITPENVAKARLTPEGLLLEGLQPGSATLTLHTGEKSIDLRVVVREAAAATPVGSWDQAQVELRGTPGLRLSALGGKLLVQGEILGRAAYQKVLLHLRNFPNNLIVLALPGAGVRESLIEQATAVLEHRGLTNIQVSNAGNRFFLEGSVSTPEELEQAYELTQAVIPNIENHLPVPIRVDPTVLVRVFILELSRQAHQALGLSWPTETPHAAVFTPSQAIFSPVWTVSLQHFASNGEARILAEPSLAVKAGSSAELSAGGEIPIRITGQWENKVEWKHYGLSVRLRIEGLAGKYIRTKIETESSQLDEATAVDGVPGLRSTSMSTVVDAVERQPILLTGLFQSAAARDVEKVPLLGNIPLLGELFKSRRFREHETELVVALVPSIGAEAANLPLRSAHGLDFEARWGK